MTTNPMNLNQKTTCSLTQKEKMILEFLESFIKQEGISPAYTEIQSHFGFASIHSVQRYIQQLEQKGYIQKGEPNQKRSLILLKASHDFANELYDPATYGSAVRLPLLGKVAAGLPLEAKTYDEQMDVPLALVPRPTESFVLRVQGESMIDEGIFDGDLIIIEKRNFAHSGSLVVVATEDESATVKRIFYKEGLVELRPANAQMQSFWYEPHKISIQGLVVGLIRQYL
ncbi:MAG: transcriptional repressor LexA [Bdellovibrionaceae bacterium]|nr:transcriptional repressor LexA [Pseudobdellovibrionaceae bacterium]